ncbi:hypothetical protein GTQ40_17805 [Flavobacteriaceae bacterium R38]|nr:hypothetical protein [Flavobacteriaceae bacterium R38]
MTGKIDYFVLSDFNIAQTPVPVHVGDMILKYHINPGELVREEIGYAMWPSERSSWRPRVWEIARGRSGNSQHCYGEKPDGTFDLEAKGATDWTCRNFLVNKDDFLEAIINFTQYTRIAVYNTFIHCDYKVTNSGRRELYSSDSNSNWVLKRVLDE